MADYKSELNADLRKAHASFWHRLKFWDAHAAAEYRAANQAQEELDNEQVQQLKQHKAQREDILQKARAWYEYIFTPKHIRLAQRAQKEIDDINRKAPEELKKEDLQNISTITLNKYTAQELIRLAKLFQNESLPEDLQNTINEKFHNDPNKFPDDDDIHYLQLTDDIINKLAKAKKINLLNEAQIISFLEKNKNISPEALSQLARKFPEELEQYITAQKAKKAEEQRRRAEAEEKAAKEAAAKAEEAKQASLRDSLRHTYPTIIDDAKNLGFDEQDILKKSKWRKFYRDTVAQIHPDKFADPKFTDEARKTALEKTTKLNGINDNLNKFYQENNIQ